MVVNPLTVVGWFIVVGCNSMVWCNIVERCSTMVERACAKVVVIVIVLTGGQKNIDSSDHFTKQWESNTGSVYLLPFWDSNRCNRCTWNIYYIRHNCRSPFDTASVFIKITVVGQCLLFMLMISITGITRAMVC